jgi:glycerophosphoryl diester phosphodiesterase
MTPDGSLDLQLLGHRGARGLAPENTLPAFAQAAAIGVSGFELDCAITRDGVVVVHHDALLNPDTARGPDGSWLRAAGPPLATLTWAELQRYDVGRIQPGSDYERRFPHQAPADGTRIPQLTELFALGRQPGAAALRFLIEMKLSPLTPERTANPEDFAQRVIAAVREGGMERRCSLLSFDWRALAAARRAAPDIPLVCLTAQQPWMDNILAGAAASPWTAPLHVSQFGGSLPRLVRAAGAAAWAPYYEELTREGLAEARSLGLAVFVWTVNEPAHIRRMIELGVEGIISDYPDRLRRAAEEAGVALPPSLTLNA